MRYMMPNPVVIGSTFYLRVHIPNDVADAASGTFISIPIGETTRTVRIRGDAVKVSLRTKDSREARQRFSAALLAVEAYWQALRTGPVSLTHKQTLALAGEVRRTWIDVLDDDPGSPDVWTKVIATSSAAREGRLNPLAVPTASTKAADLEARFGPIVDVLLSRRGLVIDRRSRRHLLERVADAMSEAEAINLAKAQGDYSDSGATSKYPAFSPSVSRNKGDAPPMGKQTFADVIDEEVGQRAAGRGGAPLPDRTVLKFRRVVSEFASHRGSDVVQTVTAREADAWKRTMLDAGVLSNSTIRQRLQNLTTVVEWARKQSLGDLFSEGNPLSLVTKPKARAVESADRTVRQDEAVAILVGARNEASPELRWLPWLCAYSGARINELAQLTADDFFQVEDNWYFRITTRGGRDVKNQYGVRKVPVHPALVEEGLISSLIEQSSDGATRLFPPRAQQNVRDWVRNKLKLTRKELAPSHGWRHLFEDLALNAGMIEAARKYITGRTSGASDEGYGKSDAMLPGLAKEMRKLASILPSDR